MLLLLKLIFLINAIHVFEAIPDKPGKCNKSAKGNRIVVKDREGEAKLLICDKNGKIFRWKMIDGNSYGNIFNPAIDCSDIMNNLPEAVTGVYWIKTDKGPREVWCDMETDGGGFMLIGVQNSPVSWDVPSQPKLVHPLASRRWSSLFGNMSIKDFRVQISTSKSFSNTKAHWYYRFNSARKLTQILLFNKGGCSSQYPGIGDIQFIKDLRNKKIVTAQFQCSRFGTHFHKSLGWGKMNDCLGTPCNSGFAFLKLTTTGSFSFSVVSSKSGIRNNSTAFIGCDRGKCCACYGPFSDRDYCGPQCQSINGGTVLSDKNKIYAWFWVRTTLPKRVWKKCMEYEKTDQEGQIIKWHVDKENGVPRKGPCSYPGDVRLNDGVVVVGSNDALQKLPNIEGLLSYRADNGKLYLRGKHLWKTMMNKGETESIIQNMEEDVTAKLQSLEDKLEKIERKLNANSGNGSVVILGNSCKDILSKYKFAISGIYWIKVASVLKPFQVYCDMETHGGGWTLVYSYAFTNYNSFTSLKNAVTPRPNWPTTSNANVPVSTTPPLSESLLGAVDWNLWRNIGQDIMIKSNINDWIVCQPNGGSLVTKKYGSMICQNIQNVANFCSGVAPKKVVWWSAGPSLDTANSQYYYFDGNTRNGWPTHDPCGKNARNYKKGVSSPGGQIYLR